MAKKNNLPASKDNKKPEDNNKDPLVGNDNDLVGNDDNKDATPKEDFNLDTWDEESRQKIKEESERRRRENAALFGDLDDEDEDDIYTLDDLKDVIQKNKALYESVQYNKQQIKALEEELIESKNKIANVQKELKIEQLKIAAQLVSELSPAVEKLKIVAAAVPTDARAADIKIERLANGVEKTTLKIADTFNKYSAPLPQETPVEKQNTAEETPAYAEPTLPAADDLDKIATLIEAEDAKSFAMGEELIALQKEAHTLLRKTKENKGIVERHQKTFEEEKEFAAAKFIKSMIQDLDTLETSVSFLGEKLRNDNPQLKTIAEGVENALNDITTVFNKYGVKQINPINQPFDENKHMALETQEVDGVAPETVVQVFQKGYEIGDRVIRHAKVIVTPAS